jgi:hypothetical protein
MFFDKYFEIHDAKSKIDWLLQWSLSSALKQQKMDKLFQELCEAIPDISNQYSNPDGMNCMDIKSPDYAPFYAYKIRAQHSFQIFFTLKMIQKYCGNIPFTLIDVGDSSGNHIKYLQHLQKAHSFSIKDAYSVNLDPIAIEKINKNGGRGILQRAELLNEINIKADVMLSFEMLEHLSSPVEFLHQLSKNPPSKFTLFTVPYLRKSRVGLHHVRLNIDDMTADPEDVHIFELNPEDWKLLAMHCGWEVTDELIYRQYPDHFMYRWLRPLWEKYEYIGFYGFTLKPNDKFNKLYSGW